ncbi:hypothetical protein DGN16_23045 [Xanthomonas citri pv. fuscans]|nr:hypothetical protein ST33_22255 [Xanthomonas citri pv. fuscans]QWN05565.1 hypothetical protein DGN16_23045 [Xanthomonas citri pv. fuscans]
MPGFQWTGVHLNDHSTDTDTALEGVAVVRLIERVGGTWFARLDYQRPALAGPNKSRDCSSFEQGKRGAEIWAERHQERLRREVAAIIADYPHNA